MSDSELTSGAKYKLLLHFNDPTLQPTCTKIPAQATLLATPVQLLGENKWLISRTCSCSLERLGVETW